MITGKSYLTDFKLYSVWGENNTLTLKATNLDIGIEITVPPKIEER